MTDDLIAHLPFKVGDIIFINTYNNTSNGAGVEVYVLRSTVPGKAPIVLNWPKTCDDKMLISNASAGNIIDKLVSSFGLELESHVLSRTLDVKYFVVRKCHDSFV